MRKISLLALLLTLLLIISGCGASENQGSDKNSGQDEEGSAIVDFTSFTTTDIYGEELDQDIFQDYQLTMVNVWGTFCGPCIEEMPDLGEIQKEYKDKGVNIIGIVVDVQDADFSPIEKQLKKARDIAEMTEADYPHLLITNELVLAKIGEVAAIPTSFFVDSQGNFVGETYVGSKDKEGWVDIIEKNLE